MELLAEAISEGIAPAIVIAIFLIVNKLIDNKKENIKIKLSSDIINCINNINFFINDITENIINKDKNKCQMAIEDAMFAAGLRLSMFVATTIVNNHIETNKENILSNIKNIINSEYYSVYSTLSLYKINNKEVSSYLKKEWMDDVEKDIIDVIYNTNLNKEDKILTFVNKINLRFQTYVTYINNNVLKCQL